MVDELGDVYVGGRLSDGNNQLPELGFGNTWALTIYQKSGTSISNFTTANTVRSSPTTVLTASSTTINYNNNFPHGRRDDFLFVGNGTMFAVMAKDEKGLLGLLERLRDVFADIPRKPDGAEPFASLRGRLVMPVRGQVSTRFGGSDANGRRISGWLIDAASGSEVHAVARGRVAYADWLKGYGLLLIVDHGDGWMSLYAFNDALLKDVGDWVRSGDPLATVGSSGGQGRPALYFELRRNGQPQDPKPWLRP